MKNSFVRARNCNTMKPHNEVALSMKIPSLRSIFLISIYSYMLILAIKLKILLCYKDVRCIKVHLYEPSICDTLHVHLQTLNVLSSSRTSGRFWFLPIMIHQWTINSCIFRKNKQDSATVAAIGRDKFFFHLLWFFIQENASILTAMQGD